MSWASVANNQLVSRANLQDAVDTGVFVLNAGQTIPATTPLKQVTTTEAETWCFLTATDVGGLGRVPIKEWFIPLTTDGFSLKGTNVGDPSDTFVEVYLYNGVTLLATITFPSPIASGNNTTVTGNSPLATITKVGFLVTGTNGLNYGMSVIKNGGSNLVSGSPVFTMSGSPMTEIKDITTTALTDGDTLEVVYYAVLT